MSTWAEKIEAFGKPAHKNVSVFIENVTSEEVENVLDTIAKNTRWTYKEIKSKDNKKVIVYQTTPLGQFSLTNFQIIEYVFTPHESGVSLDIESRYVYSTNEPNMIVAFPLHAFTPNQFWDFFGKNDQNIQYILNSLHQIYPAIKKVTNTQNTNHKSPEKVSNSFLLLALMKMYFLLIILLLVFVAFYGIAQIAFNYYQIYLK